MKYVLILLGWYLDLLLYLTISFLGRNLFTSALDWGRKLPRDLDTGMGTGAACWA